MNKMLVYIAQEKAEIDVDPVESVFSALRRHGINLASSCGGAGTCGKCKVIIKGVKARISKEEEIMLSPVELSRGVRLACYQRAGACPIVEIEASSQFRILTTGLEIKARLDPLAKTRKIVVPTPTTGAQQDLLSLLLDGEGLSSLSTGCLPILGRVAYGQELTATIIGDRIVDLALGEKTVQQKPPAMSGVAIDIGTTTIAAYLVDLQTGKELAVSSLANPQRQYGADLISRIHYAANDTNGVLTLQQSLLWALNELLEKLSNLAQRPVETITSIVIAANTVMLHTLLGVHALHIANAPFTPIFTGQATLQPQELGLKMAPHGQIVLLPSISGYLGADIIADLLVCDFPTDPNWYGLLIDIGTNGEIVLGNGIKAVACSAAAGPALEGANIKHGMPSIFGAISSFSIAGGKAAYETIGNGAARGICGSGLVNIVAELIKHGFLEPNGAFVQPAKLQPWQRRFITSGDGLVSFLVVAGAETENGLPIVLTQKDIREVQLAKGAIRAGVRTLLQTMGITLAEVSRLFLAGGFGCSLSIEHASILGIIPRQLRDEVTKIGNGAGLGAKLALIDKGYLKKASTYQRAVHYVELATHTDFQKFFMEELFF